MRPPPPLNFIRSFECAARHLSFTRAAQELGYTQAAISTHVRALEQYVGRPLFLRRARSLELTEAGEAFLPTLRQALSQIDNATNAVAASGRKRSVVLAAPMSLAENCLPQMLAAFRAAHPEIEVLVHGTIWDAPTDEIADLTISIRRNDEPTEGAARLWDERLVLLCAPDQADGLRRPAQISGFPRIVVSGRQEYWAIMAGALGIANLDGAHPLRTNSSNISLEMAACGLGLTVALSSLAEAYLRRGLLAEPFAERPESPWSYYIRVGQGAAVRRLHDHIVAWPGTGPVTGAG